MNIFLIPYTWVRHFQFAIWSALCGLIAWWMYLLTMTQGWIFWSAAWDAFVTNALLVASVVCANVLGEASLRRWTIGVRIRKLLLAGSIGVGTCLLMNWTWHLVASMMLEDIGSVYHIVALKYRWGDFVGAGLSMAVGLLTVEKWKERPKSFVLQYLLGGVFAGLSTGAMWSITSYYGVQDLYWAGAVMFMVSGASFGLAVRTIPDDLYVGWVRILSGSRFGHRIPIDAKDKRPKERFIGSYPNGLDMFFPFEEQVQPLHGSIVHLPHNNTYTLRGLSQNHIKMLRMLEWAKLNYNPTSSVPLEVELGNCDRVELGEQVTVEFLILPREER